MNKSLQGEKSVACEVLMLVTEEINFANLTWYFAPLMDQNFSKLFFNCRRSIGNLLLVTSTHLLVGFEFSSSSIRFLIYSRLLLYRFCTNF